MNPVRFWQWLSREHTAISAMAAIVAMIAGLSGTAFGIITLTGNEGSAARELEQAAVSIERRLGPDAQFYDVRDIIVPAEEVRARLPESQYFSDDGFYALDEDDMGEWRYDLITESEFYELSLGSLEGLDELPELPLHLWRSEIHDVTAPIELNQFDYVFVERISLEQLSELFSFGVEEPETEGGAGAGADEAVEQLARQYRGDSTGALLVGQLAFLLPYGVADVRPVLNSVQKTGNVVYAKATLEISDAVVDGETYDQFFLEREVMIVSTATDVWLIQTSVGSADRLSPSFEWIDDWFLRFGIVEGA
jgi:hypothetical protein